MIECKDSLEFLKTFDDYTFDINYSDPPYALGSEVIIRPDGKVDYKKANDFMNKWEMPTGAYWEQWFKEAYRTLKHGGYLVMFGMDRQLLLFKYYANLAGFVEQQSLYWYFISNFPKATDLSKQIDKNAGAERNITGNKSGAKNNSDNSMASSFIKGSVGYNENYDLTAPSTELAKKYEGYKYSISPLKQTNETIMVFQKPYKTGSCLHDTLAYENGDETCGCFALNIDGNRVPSSEELGRNNNTNPYGSSLSWSVSSTPPQNNVGQVEGRYPSQTFCDSNTAEVLDKQSGIKTSRPNNVIDNEKLDKGMWEDDFGYKNRMPSNYNDVAGCSKILHKCDFEENEHDLYFYNPKVSKSERNAGCDNFPLTNENRNNAALTNVENRQATVRNSHPTLKPIKLNERILKLFKTPNEQKIIYPFAGSGSEIIGGIKAGFTNWCGCELSQDYIDIANARIEYWVNKFKEDNAQGSIFDFIGDD